MSPTEQKLTFAKEQPKQGAPGADQSRVARPTRRVGALLGFLLKAEADAIFQQQPFETTGGQDPSDLWRTFDTQRQRLAAIAQAQVAELPDELAGVVDEIKKRQTYKKHYEAVADYSFVLAPIESLLAPQWYADLDYIDELAAGLSENMTDEEHLRFAMSEGRITEPIVTGNQVVFTSPRRDLHADQFPKVREVGEGDFEIVVRASSRPNYIQVAQIANRLVLINGVHKVCSLYARGVTHCPVLLRTAHNLEEGGMNPRSTSLFRQPIFEGPRPALVTDFLNPQTAVPLVMRSMYQVLQVVVNVGTLSVPALPDAPLATGAASASIGKKEP